MKRKRIIKKEKDKKKVEKVVERFEQKKKGGVVKDVDIKKGDIRYPKKEKKKKAPKYVLMFFVAVLFWAGAFYFTSHPIYIGLCFAFLVFLFEFYGYAKKKLKISEDIKKMENVFPDFISLMSSNLRAGMTIDQALLTSSREEFAPLDKQIAQVGKDIVTGKKIDVALKEMGERINSEKIKKTIILITSGIQAGGNLSVLLEETASNMRERNFIEKKSASNVLMYMIFIFFAVTIGAPLLFGLSTVLVQILTNIMMDLPTEQVSVALPFTLTEISVSVNFIIWFALAFLVATDVLASLVLGLVSKGDEREGIRYIIPLVLISLAVFFVARFFLLRSFSGVFA